MTRGKRNTAQPNAQTRERVMYRKLELGMWSDEKFLELSAPPPCGQWLWVYLLTGKRTTIFPGLVVGREAVMADDLGWGLETFRATFQEVFAKGLVEADWKVGLVVVRKALLDSTGEPRETSRPTNPNQLKGWAKSWNNVPDCYLKRQYLRTLETFSERLGATFLEAFREGWRKPLAQPFDLRNQEQETGTGGIPHDLAPNAFAPFVVADSGDPEPSRTHTVAPEPEPRVTVDRRELATLKGKVDAVAADPELAARQLLRVRTMARLNDIRARVAADLRIGGVRPLHPHDVGERDLGERIRECGGEAEASCDHVLAVAEHEARDKRTVRWLTGGLFTPENWRRALGAPHPCARPKADKPLVCSFGEADWEHEDPKGAAS